MKSYTKKFFERQERAGSAMAEVITAQEQLR
jgi:hypothetical protein